MEEGTDSGGKETGFMSLIFVSETSYLHLSSVYLLTFFLNVGRLKGGG